MTEVYSADWVLPVDDAPIEHGGVAVADGRIVAVGPADELAGEKRGFADSVIVPGFVNAHTHLEYAAYAGFGDGLSDFSAWLAVHVERKRRLDWDDHVAIARLGAADCLASGVSTVGDCSFTGAAAVAAAELGLSGIVYLEVFGSDPGEALRRFAELQDRVGSAIDGRLQLGISPHAPYSASPAVYRACADLGLPTATHVSESEAELSYLRDGTGPWSGLEFLIEPIGTTGIRMLAGEGILGPRLAAVHCTRIEPPEIELLAEACAAVVHCPRSNASLGCGTAPLAELLEAGVRVGLGTDSPASAPSFDVFAEMRAALLTARAREGRPDALTARDVLRLATLGSAEALGLEDEVGSLTPGKRADLAIVSFADSAYLPWDDPEVALVLGGARERVCRTIVGGETRYTTGGAGWHELRRNAADARARMLETRSNRRR